LISKISDQIGINRIVLALSLARMGDAIGNSILFIVIPLYVAKLPAPWFPFPESVRVGILISVFGLTNALLQPFMGALSDRLGKRKPLIELGLVLVGLAIVAFVFAGQFWHLLGLRTLQGVGVALTVPASLAIMSGATEKRTRGGSMGFFSSSRMVGFALGPLLGGYLHDNFGFNAAFIAGFGFIALGLLAVQFWVREIEPPPDAVQKAKGSFKVFDRELLSIGILGAALATFIMAGDFSMISALENDFNVRLSQTATSFGIAFSALMVGRLIFQIPLGRLSDKVGRKPVIIAGLILMAPATAFLGYVATTFQFVGVRLVQGVASAAIAAPVFAVAADLSKSGGEGRQMSLIAMGFGLGIALGPLAAGILAVNSFALPFVIGGILALVAGWVVYQFVPETVDREDQSELRPDERQEEQVQGPGQREPCSSAARGD
jgi:MFS family permease